MINALYDLRLYEDGPGTPRDDERRRDTTRSRTPNAGLILIVMIRRAPFLL